MIGEDRTTVYGGAICIVGDVPASNFIGGSKEGVGFSLRSAVNVLQQKLI